MTNLFSSFDPMINIIEFSISLNWLSCTLLLFIVPQLYWLVGSQISKSMEKLFLYLEDELLAVFSTLAVPGTVFLFISFFIFILFSNFIGLFPYIFTCTSHLSITITLAIPI